MHKAPRGYTVCGKCHGKGYERGPFGMGRARECTRCKGTGVEQILPPFRDPRPPKYPGGIEEK